MARGLDFTVDHVVPVSLGGSDDLTNLVGCCKRCNSSKRNTTGPKRTDWPETPIDMPRPTTLSPWRMRLKEIRERRVMSQTQLAKAVGMFPSAINRLEKGSHPPKPETIHKLAKALKVPVEELAYWEDDEVGR